HRPLQKSSRARLRPYPRKSCTATAMQQRTFRTYTASATVASILLPTKLEGVGEGAQRVAAPSEHAVEHGLALLAPGALQGDHGAGQLRGGRCVAVDQLLGE